MLSRWAQSTFFSLEHRDFRLLFFGTVFAQLAFGMMSVVQGIVAFQLTGKNGSVGLVALGMGTTMLVFGPLGGALGDRLPKRQLLLLSQSMIGILFAAVGFLVITDRISIGLLVLSTLGLGAMFAVMGPTRQAWTGEMLAGKALANGIALNQVAMNGTRIVGPFLAGGLVAIAFIDTGGAYLGMAILFVVAVVLLLRMPVTPPPPSSGRSVGGDLSDGIGYIMRTKDLRLLILMFVGVVISAFTYQTLLPGFLENELGRPARELGFFYGIAAIGGLIITLVLAGRGAGSSRSLMYVFGAFLGLSLMGLALSPNILLALLAMAALGSFSSAFQLLNNVNLMRLCAREYYGRVMSLTMMSFGLMSVVSYPIGLTADRIGERTTLVGCAVAVFVVIAAGFLASIRLGAEESGTAPRGLEPATPPEA
jgi:MFS family permease